MADLSAVLRKTIDGLPHATPQMRAKVYEKARAAIARQIQAASPPLAEETAQARREALEDAIERTESYYTATDALADEHLGEPAEEAPPPVEPERPQPTRATPVLPRTEPPPRPSALPPTPAPAPPTAAPIERPAQMPSISDGPPGTVPPAMRTDIVPDEALPHAKRPGADKLDRPRVNSSNERPVNQRIETPKAPARAALDRANAGFVPLPVVAETEPSSGLDTSAIPAADLAGPRYPAGRRTAATRRKGGRSPLLAGVAALVLIGIGVAGFVYRDQLSALLGPKSQTSVASTDVPAPGVTPTTPGDTATATAIPGGATDGAAPPATATPTRRFTQRLLPDGTEVDEGPGTGNANAFEEGTNIAAAIPAPPETPTAVAPTTPPAATSTPPVLQAPSRPATPPAAATPGTLAVAQKAIFYEERSQNEEGTQQSGNVVWSLVEEAPAEGLPIEPAIRAVADIPGDNVKLTLTIRRNADQTLPASHVIELMFDVPPSFPGGQIANVQRLALKPTEQARGEPLVGVAGKISDGFFIIALNNLAQATQTNMNLLSKEQWIDIPLAYATGRRALLSIEKGIPGERVFKQAMDAWAASKT